MTANTLSRATQVASIHFGSINDSRKRAGLTPLTTSEVAASFADVDRYPARTKDVAKPAPSSQAADSMWGSIVQKLNATVPTRAPIAPVRSSPTPANNRAVDMSAIAAKLNAEAGLPARRAG
jgi:hypothetical protein